MGGSRAGRVIGRRGRRVRMHFKPQTGMGASLEGVLRHGWTGTYVLLLPSLLEQENATVQLNNRVEVPRENVLFWEVLRS